jgi:F-type H+-transporting ATPase subunit b
MALVVVGVLGAPGVAHAQADDHEAELREECIHILEEGGEVEDCQKAPSPILPETSEIVWGGLAFLVLLVVMVKFALPPVRRMTKAREDRIRADLERSETARVEAEEVLARYQAQLAEARAEASRILEEARQAADGVRREVVARAEADAADVRARAADDIRLAAERASSDLRRQVADLSIELAEKVVERNLDRDTQIALIDRYIDSVDNGRT